MRRAAAPDRAAPIGYSKDIILEKCTIKPDTKHGPNLYRLRAIRAYTINKN